MVKEQLRIKNFEATLISSAKGITNKLFAEHIYHLTAEGYRKLEDRIQTHCSNLAVDLNNIFWEERE